MAILTFLLGSIGFSGARLGAILLPIWFILPQEGVTMLFFAMGFSIMAALLLSNREHSRRIILFLMQLLPLLAFRLMVRLISKQGLSKPTAFLTTKAANSKAKAH